MNDLWDLVNARVKEEVPLPTHGNSPLKYSTARAAIGRHQIGQYVPRVNQSRTEWEFVKSRHLISVIKGFDSSFHHYELLNDFKPPITMQLESAWSRQQEVARAMWEININVVHETGQTNLPVKFPSYSAEHKKLLLEAYSRRCFFEAGVLATGSEHSLQTPQWKKTKCEHLWTAELPGYRFYAGKNIFLICSKKGVSLLSRDHLVVFSDLAAERYLLLETLITEEMLGKTTIPVSTYTDLLRNGDLILQKGGNEAYSVVYGLEAACSSRLVGDIKIGSPTGLTYREKVTVDLTEKALNCDVLEGYLARERIIDSLSHDANMVMQCYGLYRIWGHPTLEPLRGAVALRSITTNVRMLHYREALAISNKFKEEFVVRYFAQKKTWPALNFENLSNCNVIQEAYKNLAPPPLHHPDYRRAHWDLISFLPSFPIDPKFEILEILSDKALSLNTPDLKQHLKAGLGSGSAIERSVIIQWLKTTLSDPEAFLKNVDQMGFTSFEQSFGLREKEREGKIEARMFGLATLVKRMYIVLTEALLAEHILPLFPEITMTDDELVLDKKRIMFTKRLHARYHLFTSLDFSKWNSNMRQEETQPVFKAFDELFGFSNMFQRTHELFNPCFMYLLNGSYTPTLQEDELVPSIGSWYGHLGGIEGLRQKGWTIWTVILILLCSEKSPITLRMMGQGDNQIIKQIFPRDMSEDECMKYHYQFIQNLNQLLAKIGPPLKLEETWTSEDLFIYGKYVIYKGTAIETSYKRLLRMFKMSNEDFPTIESAISSMTANISSALSCSTTVNSEYYIYCTELVGLFQLFLSHAFFQKEPPVRLLSKAGRITIPGAADIVTGPVLDIHNLRDPSFYTKLLLLPRNLGGFPIANLPSLLIRGFPDDLELNISFLKSAHSFVKPKIQRYIEEVLSPVMSPHKSFELLLENPGALNLYIPSAPGEARRSSIIKFLKEDFEINNPSFKEFIDILGTDEDKSLVAFLKTCRPMNPVVLSAIYDATTQARARHVAGKLQKTRTLSKVAVQEGNVDLYSVIREAELNHLRSVLLIVRGKGKGEIVWSPDNCSEEHARKLRNSGWGEELFGLDCASPIEIAVMEPNTPISLCDPSYELDKGYISLQLPTFMSQESLRNPLVTGPYFPYRGSATKQRIMGAGHKVASYSSPLLSKAARLGSLIGWGIEIGGPAHRVIECILLSMTDVPLADLIPLADQTSGSVHHRLESDYVDRGGAVSVLPNFGTKMRINTFPLTAYSKGSKNVNLMFQSLISYCVTIKGTEMRYKDDKVVHPSHIHIKNSCCIKEIKEEMMEGEAIPVTFICRKNNPFLFVSKDKAIPITANVTFFPSVVPTSEDPSELQNRLIALVAYRIFDILEVTSWSQKTHSYLKPGIMINWVLKLPVLRTLEFVSLLILSFFSSQAYDCTPSEFVKKVLERVARSDIDAWRGLGNLIHAPDIHHELVKMPYKSGVSGDPEMTELILALNVKNCIEHILLYWANPTLSGNPILKVEIRSGSSCGAMLHPSILHLMQNWVGRVSTLDPISVRHAIIATINKTILGRETGYHSVVANRLIQQGSLEIVPEDLDVICKLVPEIICPRPAHGVEVSLDKAYKVIGTYTREDTCYLNSPIKEGEGSLDRNYKWHQFKIANLSTTGPYKGLALMLLAKGIDPKKILCCGDGAGGFTLSALLTYKEAQVFFNTLIQSGEQIQQTSSIPYLPCLAGFPGLETRLESLDLTNDNITDITSDYYSVMFKTKFSDHVDLVVCDAECLDYLKGVKPLTLALKIAQLGSDLSAEHVIFKTYALSPSILAHQISCFLAYYDEVEVIRCYFSNVVNSEVYLSATKRQAVRPIEITEDCITGHIVRESQTYKMDAQWPNVSVEEMIDFMVPYTDVLDPHWETTLKVEISQIMPFLISGNAIEYPKSLVDWALKTSMKKRGQIPLKRVPGWTFQLTNKIIIRWMTQWIITFCLVHPGHQDLVFGNWESLTMYWYKTQGNSWGLSMSTVYDASLNNRHNKVWKASEKLLSKHSKFINKMIGVACSLGVTARGMIGVMEGSPSERYSQQPICSRMKEFLDSVNLVHQ